MLGTDSNAVSGDRVQRPGGTWEYHAEDPLRGQPWVPDMVYRSAYPHELDEATGLPIPRSDRTAGEILWAGGLYDSTAVLGRAITATTGYHEVDPFPPYDLDHLRVNYGARDAVLDVTVLDSEEVRAVSDHRPKRLTLRRSLIPRQFTNSDSS